MFPLMVALVWLDAAPTTVADRSPRHRRWPRRLLVELAIDEGLADDAGIVYFAGGLGIAAMIGPLLRRQEAITAELRAMHELQVERRGGRERARIAREVHDVVAHSLTVVMLNLTGARRALATDPAGADEALARAEEVGRDSLDSIRQVMGLLREPGTGTDVPVPALADLPALSTAIAPAGSTWRHRSPRCPGSIRRWGWWSIASCRSR